MTSIKVKFRAPSSAAAPGSIIYQITCQRTVRRLHTAHQIFAHEWDEKRSQAATVADDGRKPLLQAINAHIRADMERLSLIVRELDARDKTFTADDIADRFKQYLQQCSLFNFAEGIIAALKANDKIRTAETYRSALNCLRKFVAETKPTIALPDNGDIMLNTLESDLMEAFEAWLRKRGIVPNTVSFYTRVLRAIYNRAVEKNITTDRQPFRHVYTGIDKTIKRALPIKTIKEIKKLNLAHQPALDFARDMFLLSFYFRGMSFVDMAFLRKTDLRGGAIIYRRRKTGQLLVIKWTRQMKAVLDKYPENSSEYLLPIIRKPDTNERYTYHNVGYNINHNLKQIAKLIHLEVPLTMYVARHSWASAAKSKGIPISIISEAMGHDSETTTQIYLASLDTTLVDQANNLILKSLDQ